MRGFNSRLLFKNNRILFSLLSSGIFVGEGFDGGGQSRDEGSPH